MIVDSSAVVALLGSEPLASRCAQAMEEAPVLRISAANYLESAIVIDARRDPVLSRRFDDLIREAAFHIETVTLQQATLAREAYRDFGKGTGHPAQLNFGDCFAYALSKATGEPLLFTGRDFTETDLVSVLD